MNYYIIILRILHIGGGIVWAGSVFYLAFFLLPAAKALGADGGKFMQQLSITNYMPSVLSATSTLTIISGVLIMWNYSQGFTNDYMGTPMAIAYSIGGILAIIAYFLGFFINRPIAAKMKLMGMQTTQNNQPPTSEQMQYAQKMRTKMEWSTHVMACLLLLTIVLMAIARNL